MPTTITDNPANWSTVVGPADGDAPTAASVNGAFQSLADRTAYIRNGAASFSGAKSFSNQVTFNGGVVINYGSDLVFQRWFFDAIVEKHQTNPPAWELNGDHWKDVRSNVVAQGAYDHPLVFPIHLPVGAKIKRVDVAQFYPAAHASLPANLPKVELIGRQFADVTIADDTINNFKLLGTMNTFLWSADCNTANYASAKLVTLNQSNASPAPSGGYFAQVDDQTTWEIRYWPEWGTNGANAWEIYGARVLYSLAAFDKGMR